VSASPLPRATLGALLRTDYLELRVDPRVPVSDTAMDVAVNWVHSSDLADPTPFLSDGVVLLTTGTQFVDEAFSFDDYVSRLASHSVLALGFGTEVVRDGIPAELALACAAFGLPLFEVPYRIPFIAVARANAQAVAAQSYARQDWALTAQRALARAALRPDGLEATIVELARQLGAWVALYDANGTRTLTHAARAANPPDTAAIDAEVDSLVRRGGTIGGNIRVDGVPVILHTIGVHGRSGVLAIAGATLDREARSVVTSVVATAGLALEQSSVARRADQRLRSTVADLLETGSASTARDVAEAAWGAFPALPWIVLLADEPLPADLRLLGGEPSRVFHGGTLVIATLTDAAAVRSAFETLGSGAGASTCDTADDLPRALDEARAALSHTGSSVTDFAELPRDLVPTLATPAALALARDLLAPVEQHDASHGTALLATLDTWLRSDGSNEAAAVALGVHRHTVRTRLALIERLLDVDLSSFAERANVWAALQLTSR